MKQDWKALAAVVSDHLGSTLGSVISAVLIGLLVSIALIVLFWKLGIFHRPANKWYNWGVKLYIPYLVVACVIIAAQCGFYRAVYVELVAANDAVVASLYERSIGPALGSPAARQSFLGSLQNTARSGQNLGQSITGAIKEALHGRVAEKRSVSDRAAMVVADWFIDRYENDIASAILYGIYLKAGDHLHLHSTGKPMEYHEFKQGAEYLLTLDLSTVETAIQGNLGALTHGLIEGQYKGMIKGVLLLGTLLILLPVLEWGIYRWMMRRYATQAQVALVEPVIKRTSPADEPTATSA